MKQVYEITEGWWQFHIMPANTTHIACFYDNGSVYLPEDGVTYEDWITAVRNGHAYKLVRADQIENLPKPVVTSEDVKDVLVLALNRHMSETLPG